MSERWRSILAGAGGAMVIGAASSLSRSGLIPVTVMHSDALPRGLAGAVACAPVVAGLLALVLVRWWPYLLLAAGGCTAITALAGQVPWQFREIVYIVSDVGLPVALIGTLGCVQSLVRERRAGAGSVVAGSAGGAYVFGSVLLGDFWIAGSAGARPWRLVLLVAGCAAVVPAVLRWWRGDAAAAGPATGPWWQWRRLRLVLAAGVATVLPLPLARLGADQVGDLIGVSAFTLERHGNAQIAVVGAITLVLVALLAAAAGRWSLAGALTAATMLVAISAPVLLGIAAVRLDQPSGWVATLAGLAAGAVVAGTRWRVAGAVVLTVGAATTVFIAWSATSGEPEKLAVQHHVVPGLVLLVTMTAAATAVFGAITPALARVGAVPAVLGPFTMVLFAAGARTVQVTYVEADGLPGSSSLNPVGHLDSAGFLLLVAGAGVAGIGAAHYLAERWAERKRAEQIRREAAAAERDRLARPIHDGVLQVLAMVQRGEAGAELAVLAGEQETALRNLLRGGGSSGRTGKDLDVNAALALPGVELSAPATPVMLAAKPAGELIAAVQAALDNVRRHAGPGARVWILLEDETDGVRVTVRDDGAGIAPGRLAEAARTGRLGVAQSMRGRITDLGGVTTIHSAPGEGTEVEFWVPR
ncbi:ATP-binding protein [Actinoplanes sp. NPDC026670]|uniref:sensor histidine kinase n=1 Tax=Actinoplanes sp. NPDC026670 TaxID=3154700 RepID=UPI0033D7194F